MRTIVVFLLVSASLHAAEAPLVEKYLHAGEFAQGEQALLRALEADPSNDQLRFGLGFLQVFRGAERMGQSFYEYGLKSENQHLPFLRLPVPANKWPTPITYPAFRRVLEAMHRDLETAEATLAGVKDDTVKLPLRLAAIRLDFKGEGHADDKFIDVLKALMRTDLQFLKGNSEFLVNFDRGDVAWLRAYCHLLMGILDVMLALDLEDSFDEHAADLFAKHQRRKTEDLPKDTWKVIGVKEPKRFSSARKHLVAVCQLNKETWKHIRVETDDDHEWLPNPKQKSVIGLPVTNERIDSWLAMMDEFEALLEGKKLIGNDLLRFLWPTIEGGLNVKKMFEDPPEKLDWDVIAKRGPQAKYLDAKGESFNFAALMQAFELFNDPTGLAYMAWFN